MLELMEGFREGAREGDGVASVELRSGERALKSLLNDGRADAGGDAGCGGDSLGRGTYTRT